MKYISEFDKIFETSEIKFLTFEIAFLNKNKNQEYSPNQKN